MTPMMEKAVSHIVLDHPFFSSILLRHPIEATTKVPTLAVNYHGRILYNAAWFEELPVAHAVFALCHEVLHYASRHALRQGGRDHMMWNMATDAWINSMLAEAKIGEVIPGAYTRYQAHRVTEEELYDQIEAEQKQNAQPKPDNSGQGDDPGQDEDSAPGDKPGDSKGNAPPPPPAPNKNDQMANDSEQAPPMVESDITEQAAEIIREVAAATQDAKMRGNLPGVLARYAASLTESKVPWFEKLERYMVDKTSTAATWSRPNRRYMPDYYLPSYDSVGAMGEVALQIDISGSVSNTEIQYYNGHIQRIIEMCRPRVVHVLYTDTSVQRYESYEAGEEFSVCYYSGGGTDMRAGLQYLTDNSIDVDCLITLTDGYTPFPAKGEDGVPTVWCISGRPGDPPIVSPVGETIAFSLHD